ncbi:extracellular solute-binding protein [Halobacteria archaeon HArc-gm2]|nr:extracellular solute-binding protein [Halobacteria archaeon HArc-gm2]
MPDSSPDSLRRRKLVQSIGLGAGIALAGCSGDGGDGGSLEGDGDGGGDSLGTETGGGDDGDGGSGADVLHWDAGLPSDEEDLDTAISNIQNFFEERTGEQVQITDYTYEDMRSAYLTGARSGDPDSVEGVLSHLTEYIEADLIEPIGDEAEALEWYDGYVDSTIEAMSYQGELYALPYTGNGRAMIYRRDVFEELGQDPPETADEFLEVGRLIKSETDLTPFHNCTKDGGVRAFQEWMSHVYQHTENLYATDGDGWTLNVDADTLGLVFDKYYHQVWASDDPIADPDQLGTGWQVNDPGYINGNFAMIECGPWIRGWTSGPEIDDSDAASEVLDENTAVAHLPYAEGGERATYLEVKPVMVNANSENGDLGFEAVASRCSPTVMEQQKSHSPGNYVTPVHEDVETTLESENWMPFTDVFETGRALAKISWGPVRQEFYPLMQEVAYGETDPYDAGSTLHSNLKSLEGDL